MAGADIVVNVEQEAMQLVDQNADLIRRLALEIHANPEPNYQEFFASDHATAMLEEFGLEVQRAVADLPTAFVATSRGSRPGPAIGLIAEYDCVPDVGHGCGHNLMCAATVAAGMGLRFVAHKLPGTVSVFGCPAEEGGKGKMHMAAKNVFAGLDAALQFHPATQAGVTSVNMLAQNINFKFKGHPAHTTAIPWEGRNALDAVIAVFNGINALRQQAHPEIRITGIITDGPTTIASIPEFASAMFRVRGFDETMVLDVVERVKACGLGAALQTGTTCEIEVEPVEPQLRCSTVLSDLLEHEGARFDISFEHHDRGHGTTDLAYVGQVAPTIMYRLATWPEGTPAHSQAAVEASKSVAALDGMLTAAKIMIGMTIDLLTSEQWLSRASQEFAVSHASTCASQSAHAEF